MIDCGSLKLIIEPDGKTHVRLRVEQEQPAGHLPKRIVDLRVVRGELAAEVGACGIYS